MPVTTTNGCAAATITCEPRIACKPAGLPRMLGEGWRRLLLVWLVAVLAFGHVAPAAAVDYKICPDPGVCFSDAATKAKWAEERSCRFLEDVCEKAPVADDDQGAPAGDKPFWRELWDGVAGALQYGYEFVKGLIFGLKDQVEGIVALLTDFGDVVDGLVALGKSFYNDPKGTVAKLGEVLGQDIVDTITRATACGPYDLGKVIGENVSPVLVAKLATKIARYSGDIGRAARATRVELGCASFAAGTLVLTPQGRVAIEQIAVGQAVLSRGERGFADAPQSVAKTFNRTADHVHRLMTEFDALSVTEEHPLWLQGAGWTPVKELKRGDIVATANGDATVLENERLDGPVRVYNFSVAHTPSYFVGQGVWAHNASCDLGRDWAKLTPKEKGLRAELDAAARLTLKKYERVGKTFDPADYPDDAARMAAWNGQTGIDGIFKNDKGEYVIIESKGKGIENKGDLDGCVDKLCKMTTGERQMSEAWVADRLDKLGVTGAERAAILAGVRNNTVKRVYAQTDGGQTIFNEITTPTDRFGRPNPRDAVIGGRWEP